MKRLFDILASGLGLLILCPLFIILSILIKIDSKGPVFYRQVRVGRNNKDFSIFKLRSMHVGSDKDSLVTIGGRDPRITSLGYFIRKFKFDELPPVDKCIHRRYEFSWSSSGSSSLCKLLDRRTNACFRCTTRYN